MARVFRHYVPRWLIGLAFVDACTLVLSIYLAIFLRWGNLREFGGEIIGHIGDAITFTSIILFSMYSQGLYSRPYVKDNKSVLARLVVAYIIAIPLMSIVFYLLPETTIWRSSLVIASTVSFVALFHIRYFVNHVSSLAHLKRRVLVLGAGARAARIATVEGQSGSRFVCAGFVPTNESSVEIDGRRLIADVSSLPAYVERNAIQEVVVAPEDRRGAFPVRSLLDCKLFGTQITDFSTFMERETGRVELEALFPSWLIFSDGFPGGRMQGVLKRVFDIVVSLGFLVFAWPVIVATAIAIRLEGQGPIFYRQQRVGLNGEPFMLMKFRSMHVDAEKAGPQWAAVKDPRITPVGAFIRNTRIDEMPQVFNVLGGSMSFIGPRPERPFFVDRLCESIPYYSERHRVKPGITGWAQIHYPYGASEEDAKEKLKYDLYYIKNYSLFLDFIILVQTAQVVFWPQGAR
ncbi:MAG: TIGR03013 family XrtA/PEP-CTERM system glycosyltransferase [Alphaproteobacteria bacterium]